MKRRKSNKIHRKHSLIKVLGIVALSLVILVSTANAGQTYIYSISTDPSPPIYENMGDRHISLFDITVNVANPPVGGYLKYSIGSMSFYSGYVTIDNNGVATFPVSIWKLYWMGNLVSDEPSTLFLRVYDVNGNIVASDEKFIKIYEAGEIPEFPSISLPLVAILCMIAVIGRRKE